MHLFVQNTKITNKMSYIFTNLNPTQTKCQKESNLTGNYIIFVSN